METSSLSEQQNTMLLSDLPDAVLILKNGIIIFANKAALHATEYSWDELIGSRFINYVAGCDRDFVLNNMNKNIALEKVEEYECQLIRKSGAIQTVIIRTAQTKFEGEEVSLFVLFDVSDRQHTEKALHERINHSQSLLRLSKKLELAQTYEEVFVAAREEVRNIIGYRYLWLYLLSEDKKYFKCVVSDGPITKDMKPDESPYTLMISGDQMLEEIAEAKNIVIVKDARTDPRTNKEIVAQLKNRTIVNVPIILFDKHLGALGTGTFGDEEVRVPTGSEEEFLGAVASHLAVVIDRLHLLYERERTEKEKEINRCIQETVNRILQISIEPQDFNKRLLLSLEVLINAPILKFQKKGGIFLFDLNKDVLVLTAAINLPQGVRNMCAFVAPGKCHCGEVVLTKQIKYTGSVDCTHDNIYQGLEPHGHYNVPILHAGKVLGVIVLYLSIDHQRDEFEVKFLLSVADILSGIIQRHQIIEEMVQAKELAEQSNRLKDAFIANISHEIRTPLHGINGMTNIIKDLMSEHISEAEEGYFTGVERSISRITRTMDMILNFSRLQVGDFPVMPKKINISKFLHSLVSEYREIAAKKPLDIYFEHLMGEVFITSDVFCFEQAVIALLDNAVKFTNLGYIKLKLYKNKLGDVLLDIQDSGIGISGEYLKRLFEPYSQEQIGFSRTYEGVGLGLPLAKKFLNLNNMDISVVSEKWVGSTFTIRFDALHTEVIQNNMNEYGCNKAQEETLPPAGLNRAGNKPAILLVEDDATNQSYIGYILQPDYDITVVSSAASALEKLHSQRFLLILMDISLQGGINGLELIRVLKNSALYAKIPIIAVTGHALREDREIILAAGCNEYLAKPFTKFELMEKIAKYKLESHIANTY
ncbi:MAG: response regulator [Ignavibacteriales bacterium]|nr:response regulator [Ignavibacteriales bacterium]